MGLPWHKLVGLTADEASAMRGHRRKLVAKIQEKMQENVASELTGYHYIIHQESLWRYVTVTIT